MTKERSIRLHAHDVCAILAGQKTVLRQVVRNVPSWAVMVENLPGGRADFYSADARDNGAGGLCADQWCFVMNPYGAPGDHLWVKETWRRDDFAPDDVTRTLYQSDMPKDALSETRGIVRWVPSIHLPRARSRLTLAVTDVRVERLHAITPKDAQREGVEHYWHALNESDARTFGNRWTEYAVRYGYEKTAPDWRGAFASLWDMINSKRAPWASNPWTWRITFARVTP